VLSHLGNDLLPCQKAVGYDLTAGNFNESDYEEAERRYSLPDVILVRRSFSKNRRNNRNFKVKQLAKSEGDIKRNGESQKADRDYDQFLNDLEEDPDLRSNVVLYKKDGAPQSSSSVMVTDDDDDEHDMPKIPIEELVEEMEQMDIQDHDDEEGEGEEADSDEEFEHVEWNGEQNK